MNGDRTVVVTGAAAGIGRAIAERFATDYWRVIAVDRDPAVHDVLGSLSGGGPHGAVDGDIADPVTHERAADLAGRAAAWVNCAGITQVMDLANLEEQAVRRVVDVNLLGTLWGTSMALRILAPEASAIVNISSVHAARAYAGYGVYEMTKAGIDAITRGAAIHGASRGIRANAIAPGAIATASLEQSLTSAQDASAARRTLANRAPLSRIGDPSEIASVAVFLASPGASYLTGQIVAVDGGWSALLGRDADERQHRPVGGAE